MEHEPREHQAYQTYEGRDVYEACASYEMQEELSHHQEYYQPYLLRPFTRQFSWLLESLWNLDRVSPLLIQMSTSVICPEKGPHVKHPGTTTSLYMGSGSSPTTYL